ncbi:MAG TPA: LytTR family transcriptional regulator DNA-binding domain-containing protein [Gemmatimonadaceae bacterium]
MKRREFLGTAAGAVAAGALGACASRYGVRRGTPGMAMTPGPMDAAAFHASRRFARTGFGRIAYVERGSGDAALFLHGYPLNGFQWRGALDRNRRPPYLSRFAVREAGRVRFVAVGDVDWIEADGNYLVLHAGERTHRMRGTLARVAEQLDPTVFARVHRSAVVNVDRIREVQPWFGGDYIAILRNGAKLRVSRQRAARLLRPLG